jgi:hypothetical protein
MTGKIFINYRRDDSGNAGRLFDRLSGVFAKDQLFFDVDDIAPGLDFVRVLDERVAECDVLLAVISKGWIEAQDATGARRLDDPDDFVRVEIESALRQDKRVIPILVGEVRMPRAEELPDAMRPLVRRNAVRLTYERFNADTQGLIKALQQTLAEIGASRPSPAEAPKPARVERERGRQSAAATKGAAAAPAVVGRVGNYFATGLRIGAPVLLTLAVVFVVIWFVIGPVDKWVQRPLQRLLGRFDPDSLLNGVDGVIVCLAVLALPAFLTANALGQKLFAFFGALLERLPVAQWIYGTNQKIFETLLPSQTDSARRNVADRAESNQDAAKPDGA